MIFNYTGKKKAQGFFQFSFCQFKSQTEAVSQYCSIITQRRSAIFKGKIIVFAYKPLFQSSISVILTHGQKRDQCVAFVSLLIQKIFPENILAICGHPLVPTEAWFRHTNAQTSPL